MSKIQVKIIETYKVLDQWSGKRRKIMLATLTGSQLRELYHLALSCCGNNNTWSKKTSQMKQNADLSLQRMQMIISLAMEQSTFFRNYAARVISKQ